MKHVAAAFSLMLVAEPALASNRAEASAIDLERAIAEIADTSVYRYGPQPVKAADIRVIKCIGPDQEPTEFECTWQHHVSDKWLRYKTWLAIDGKGWHVID